MTSKMHPDLGTGRKDFCQRRETLGSETCDCDGYWPHAPGWQDDETPAYQPSDNPWDFDHADLLNEDGTVTLRMTPSAWHVYNMSPDTYQMFNGDSWCEYEIEYLNSGERSLSEMFGDEYANLDDAKDLGYDHFDWDYNHSAIVRDLAEELANWMQGRLWDMGLESVSVEVRDTWSPQFYNFTSDGFEVEVTCNPAQLRELTPDFDVDKWAAEHYRSRDGFLSYVTSRMNDAEWRAEYDGGFRVESMFAGDAEYRYEQDWVMALAEVEHEVYAEHVKVTPNVDKIREQVVYLDSEYTLSELEEWARELHAVYVAGMEPLPTV
jgi:hypothetical protein